MHWPVLSRKEAALGGTLEIKFWPIVGKHAQFQKPLVIAMQNCYWSDQRHGSEDRGKPLTSAIGAAGAELWSID